MVDSKVCLAWIKNLTSDHEFIRFSGHSICQTLRFFCLSGFDLYFQPLRASRLYCAPLFPFWNDFTHLKRKKSHKAFLHLWTPNHAYRLDKLKSYLLIKYRNWHYVPEQACRHLCWQLRLAGRAGFVCWFPLPFETVQKSSGRQSFSLKTVEDVKVRNP